MLLNTFISAPCLRNKQPTPTFSACGIQKTLIFFFFFFELTFLNLPTYRLINIYGIVAFYVNKTFISIGLELRIRSLRTHCSHTHVRVCTGNKRKPTSCQATLSL